MKKIDMINELEKNREYVENIINELEKQKMHYEVKMFKNKTIFNCNNDYKFSIILKDNIKCKPSLFSVDIIIFYKKYIHFYFIYYEHELYIKVYYNQIHKINISKVKVLNSKEIEKNVL